MKKVIYAVIAMSTLIFTQLVFAKTEIYQIDPDHSTVAFSVNHLGFSNISGRFTNVKGKITLNKDKLKASSVSIIINSNSINSAHNKRDEHLRSPDFFDVEQFSKITFESTKLEITKNDQAKMTGELTIMGITKTVILDVKFNKEGINPFLPENYVAGFSVNGKINRSDFGMTFGVPMISDEVALNIEVEAIRISNQ